MKRIGKAALLFVLFSLALYGAFTYSYVPKKLYVNQVFPVTILESDTSGEMPHFRFTQAAQNAKLIVKKPLLIRNGNDRFFTLYFKATGGGNVFLPPLVVTTGREEVTLPAQRIPVSSLPERDAFCGVLATDMSIRYAQVSHYDETHYLVTLSIEAYEANLEDMRLRGYAEQGIENMQRRFAKTTAEFYVVVPSSQKSLAFEYYNTVKERFVALHAAVELNDATVATQTDLNPKEDKFDTFKKYTFIGLTSFFFIMFLVSRDLFYLALGAVSLIVLGNFYMPRKEICVKEGSPLYILPTATSDISTRVDHELHTPLLNTRGIYNKIELKPGIVGWVKNEDLCEN